MSALFSPLQVKSLTLRNRIAVAPMCQYSASEGLANDWHLHHYAGLARGGAGLVVVEAADLDAALAWAGKLSRAVTLPIEVRPVAHGG